MTMRITLLHASDEAAVLRLYRAASAVADSGLARSAEEIDSVYVRGFVERAVSSGIILGAHIDGDLVGEIHATRPGPRQFDHVLGDLTVAVSPFAQGRGVGSALFAAFFDAARALVPAIDRIELMARSGNARALGLYERLGFIREGRLIGRVSLPDGRIEDDIPLALYLSASKRTRDLPSSSSR